MKKTLWNETYKAYIRVSDLKYYVYLSVSPQQSGR